MLRLGICSDDEMILKLLHKMLETQYGEQIDVVEWKTSEQLASYNEVTDSVPVDIALVDIVSNKDKGIVLAKKLQMLSRRIKIIFVAEYLVNPIDFFHMEPVDILRKPISVTKLVEAIEKAAEKIHLDEMRVLTLQSKGVVSRVNSDLISYLETRERKVLIHQNREVISVYMKMDELEEKLGDTFLRCHHSYLINMEYIRTFSSQEIELVDGTKIPVSRPKSKYARIRFLTYLGEKSIN